jgi:tetratricopeptide (TPR) repeat protein
METATAPLFGRGQALHRAGRLVEARDCYNAVLLQSPQHFDALHQLGTVYAQMGEPALAVPVLERAVKLNPANDVAVFVLGAVLSDCGRFADAIVQLDKAIALDPRFAEAHYSRGLSLNALERFVEALASYDKAIAANPRFALAHNNRGSVLSTLKRFEEAVASFDAALALDPRYEIALINRGRALKELERPGEAAESYRRAIALNPNSADAHHELGVVLGDLERHEEALLSLDRAIELRPDFATAFYHRGLALTELERLEDALASYDSAAALDPRDADALNNHGHMLTRLNRVEDALASFDRAIALDPGDPDAHNNRGHLLSQLNRVDDALASYEEAIALRSDYAEAQFNRSLSLLSVGRLSEGFEAYQWRWKQSAAPHGMAILPAPLWDGGSLEGKSIVVYCEQGYGDSLHFVRYVGLLTHLAASVTLVAPSPLVSLFQSIPGVEVRSTYEYLTCDCHIPLMCLPRLLGTTLETIPGDTPYLFADREKLDHWSERLAGEPPALKVGLVWAGDSRKHNPGANAVDRRRSLRLQQFAPIASIEGVRFFSLQKGEPAEQAANPPPGMSLIDLTAELADFSDTAALVANLDVVITVDTSVAHLAGALAKPVWILSRFDGCWRWLNGREDSPWYPTARLFHQQAPGAWDEVIDRVRQELAAITT